MTADEGQPRARALLRPVVGKAVVIGIDYHEHRAAAAAAAAAAASSESPAPAAPGTQRHPIPPVARTAADAATSAVRRLRGLGFHGGIRLLTDVGNAETLPTKAVVEDALAWLGAGCRPGATLLLVFIGAVAFTGDVLPVDFPEVGGMSVERIADTVSTRMCEGARLLILTDPLPHLTAQADETATVPLRYREVFAPSGAAGIAVSTCAAPALASARNIDVVAITCRCRWDELNGGSTTDVGGGDEKDNGDDDNDNDSDGKKNAAQSKAAAAIERLPVGTEALLGTLEELWEAAAAAAVDATEGATDGKEKKKDDTEGDDASNPSPAAVAAFLRDVEQHYGAVVRRSIAKDDAVTPAVMHEWGAVATDGLEALYNDVGGYFEPTEEERENQTNGTVKGRGVKRNQRAAALRKGKPSTTGEKGFTPEARRCVGTLRNMSRRHFQAGGADAHADANLREGDANAAAAAATTPAEPGTPHPRRLALARERFQRDLEARSATATPQSLLPSRVAKLPAAVLLDYVGLPFVKLCRVLAADASVPVPHGYADVRLFHTLLGKHFGGMHRERAAATGRDVAFPHTPADAYGGVVAGGAVAKGAGEEGSHAAAAAAACLDAFANDVRTRLEDSRDDPLGPPLIARVGAMDAGELVRFAHLDIEGIAAALEVNIGEAGGRDAQRLGVLQNMIATHLQPAARHLRNAEIRAAHLHHPEVDPVYLNVARQPGAGGAAVSAASRGHSRGGERSPGAADPAAPPALVPTLLPSLADFCEKMVRRAGRDRRVPVDPDAHESHGDAVDPAEKDDGDDGKAKAGAEKTAEAAKGAAWGATRIESLPPPAHSVLVLGSNLPIRDVRATPVFPVPLDWRGHGVLPERYHDVWRKGARGGAGASAPAARVAVYELHQGEAVGGPSPLRPRSVGGDGAIVVRDPHTDAPAGLHTTWQPRIGYIAGGADLLDGPLWLTLQEACDLAATTRNCAGFSFSEPDGWDAWTVGVDETADSQAQARTLLARLRPDQHAWFYFKPIANVTGRGWITFVPADVAEGELNKVAPGVPAPDVAAEKAAAAAGDEADGDGYAARCLRKHGFHPGWRQRLFNFYQHYNPAKLPSVVATLRAFRGHEVEVFQTLVAKYGPVPPDTTLDIPPGWALVESKDGDLYYKHAGGRVQWARPTGPPEHDARNL